VLVRFSLWGFSLSEYDFFLPGAGRPLSFSAGAEMWTGHLFFLLPVEALVLRRPFFRHFLRWGECVRLFFSLPFEAYEMSTFWVRLLSRGLELVGYPPPRC